ncbi:MAG: alpha/beta hydrolase [Deltaproteobacteria bacterium]
MPSEELKVVIEMLEARPVLADASFEQLRAGMAEMAVLASLPEGVTTETVLAGGVKAEWVSAAGADEFRVLLYLHGGGYCIGSIDTHRAMVASLSEASGMKALALDYRLAPEHPHPAAVDDAVAAYRWLLANSVAPERIAIAGDSAGGGLSAATLVALREAGDPLPAAAVLISPWTDLAATGGSITERADIDPMIDMAVLNRMAVAYAGQTSTKDPSVSPLYAGLAGLPPLLIQVGTAEVLYDDSVRLAELARAAGVEVSFEAWEDMIHVFQAFGALLPEAGEAIGKIGDFLRDKVR